jgi:hypothetical protein
MLKIIGGANLGRPIRLAMLGIGLTVNSFKVADFLERWLVQLGLGL